MCVWLLSVLKPLGVWAIGLITKDLVNYFVGLASGWVAKRNAAKAIQDYENTLKNPESTVKEQEDAGEKIINS